METLKLYIRERLSSPELKKVRDEVVLVVWKAVCEVLDKGAIALIKSAEVELDGDACTESAVCAGSAAGSHVVMIEDRLLEVNKDCTETLCEINTGKEIESDRESPKSIACEDMDTQEYIEYTMRAGHTDATIIDNMLDLSCPKEAFADLLVLIRKLLGIVQPGMAIEAEGERIYRTTRATNCMLCGRPGKVQVTFEYTEGGKVAKADITGMEKGWEMKPYGDAGGEAPYCPECLERMGTTKEET